MNHLNNLYFIFQELSKKYANIQVSITNTFQNTAGYDPNRCILIEYFGRTLSIKFRMHQMLK
jgi:hypothetical protein